MIVCVGNDDKIRRRVYKRSSGSHDEIEGPISPKVMRTNELHPAYTSASYAPNSLPTTGRQSLNPGAGSTGSQSGSQVKFYLKNFTLKILP